MSVFEDTMAEYGAQLGAAIRDAIPIYITAAEVESVDEENRTLNAVVDDMNVLRDIALDVFPNGGNSVYLVPAVGSLILVGFVEGYNESPVIIRTTKIDKLIIDNKPDEEREEGEQSYIYLDDDRVQVIRKGTSWTLEDKKISLSAELIEMNGGGLGSSVVAERLTEVLEDIASKFNDHLHPVTAVGSPTEGPDKSISIDSGSYTNTAITQ